MPPGRMETPNRLAPNVARIRVLSGLDGGGQITAELRPGRNILGRGDDCDVQLQSDGLSVHHAAITISQGGGGDSQVQDLGSTNKSQIGSLEEPVTMEANQPYPLEHGDIVIFGTVVCVFLWPGSAAGLARTTARSGGGGTGGHTRQGTGAEWGGNASNAEVLSQMDLLMQDMSHLYSVVRGGERSPGNASKSSLLASRYRGDHSSSQDLSLSDMHHEMSEAVSGRTRGGQDERNSLIPGSPTASSIRWGTGTARSTTGSRSQGGGREGWGDGGGQGDRWDMMSSSRQSPARVSTGVASSRSQGVVIDRIGQNLQGAGDTSVASRPDTASDAPLAGLRRSGVVAPAGRQLSGRDLQHLYRGISREGSRDATARARTARSSRPGTMASARDQGPDVYLGRFALPEACVLHVLSFLPRLPGLLRVAGVSPYFRRLTQENVLWEQLDLSWDTLARDPICLRMTDEILVDLMQRMYRKLLHKVELSGCAFVSDWTLLAISRYCFLVTEVSLRRHADIGPEVTDAGVVELARRVPKLEKLDLTCCSSLTNTSISTIAEHCPRLVDLDLSGCDRITDLAVMSLANSECGARLERLLLQSCQLLTGEAVQELANRCTSLTEVSLAACERVRGDAVANLVNSCTRLSILNITQCHQVADLNLRNMATSCTRLRRLRMGYCRNVTDEGFKDLARFVTALEFADLRGLRKISDASLHKVASVARLLTHLDIRGCQSLSLTAVQTAKRALPECHVIFSSVS